MTAKTTMTNLVDNLNDLAALADYSFLNNLSMDPQATDDGHDHQPRQVFSGHYVPVTPTPIAHQQYVAHSFDLFAELGLADSLAHSEAFEQMFSGDLSQLPKPMHHYGWATGYALSIYGTEYTQQCPFQTGNGYGDGRAISVLEGVFNGTRYEMQLKGAGPTPYCRGADGRAVLRSSVREFLAQEHMHALGVPTSRSLCLFASTTETVARPWYRENSTSYDPEIMVSNRVAITTRVASSFLRVGQLELFARRARVQQHPNALQELNDIVKHLIAREYANDVDANLPWVEQLVQLATVFRERLTSLVVNWIRVGYCQGNFNSDNCAAGGFTLDYGPFGFCEQFDPRFQPWTGGGQHFSFLNQPLAAQQNFIMFCRSLVPLFAQAPDEISKLETLCNEFGEVIERKMQAMWASKLGLVEHDEALVDTLLQLMQRTGVDYNLLFSTLCALPKVVSEIAASFYSSPNQALIQEWQSWLDSWHKALNDTPHADSKLMGLQYAAERMTKANPKYVWREWLIAPAYQQAERGDYRLIQELQQVLTNPYGQQAEEITQKYCRIRPAEFANLAGVSHYSCSS